MLLLFIISFSLSPIGNPPTNNYPYQAKITLNNRDNKTDIYFSQFSQEGNIVTIPQYVIHATHWADFDAYNLITTPLVIILTDNDNKFIYDNRLTGESYNNPVKSNSPATQP